MTGGVALELCTYMEEKDRVDDCMVGVHIDWDSEIHNMVNQDVLNLS